LIDRGLAVAPDTGVMIASASTKSAAPRAGIGPDLRGRRDNWGTPLLWQRVDVLSQQIRY
jgi:hypothetical protein